jgi:hypothetical protein
VRRMKFSAWLAGSYMQNVPRVLAGLLVQPCGACVI